MILSIIIPCFNEENTILEILEKVNFQRKAFNIQIIVSDDGSTDNTLTLLQKNPHLYDILIKNKINLGKGAAIISAKSQIKGDIILIQDADLEYDPNDYVKLLEPVLRFKADVVMGSRLSAPPFTRVYYFWHKFGNKFITLLFNIFNNTTFTDIYSCYILFKSDLLKAEDLLTNGWEQQAEILSPSKIKNHNQILVGEIKVRIP